MAHRAREPRKPVKIGVRLKDDSGWSDAQILNVSSRGVMAVCEHPPKRGSYVEMRRGTYVMIGRVAWNGSDRIGVHVREKIELDQLLQPVVPGRRQPRPDEGVHVRIRERREPTVEERAAASHRFARAFNFVAIAAVVAGAAVIASSVVSNVLSEPMDKVELVLTGGSR